MNGGLSWIRDVTAWCIVGGVLCVAAYDLWAYRYCGPECTISGRINEWSREYLLIPFALGWLLCHLLSAHPAHTVVTSAAPPHGTLSSPSVSATPSSSNSAAATP